MRPFTGKVVRNSDGNSYNALPFPYCIRWRWKVCWSIRRTVVLKNTNKTAKLEIKKKHTTFTKDKVVVFTVWSTVLAAKIKLRKWQLLTGTLFFFFLALTIEFSATWNRWVNSSEMCLQVLREYINSINRRLGKILTTIKLIQVSKKWPQTCEKKYWTKGTFFIAQFHELSSNKH